MLVQNAVEGHARVHVLIDQRIDPIPRALMTNAEAVMHQDRFSLAGIDDGGVRRVGGFEKE